MAHPVLSFRRWSRVRESDYRGAHEAPSRNTGDPFHDVTRAIYPEDFYGPNGLRHYGTGDPALDIESYRKILSARNRPNLRVQIYRSIPASVPKSEQRINPGDWVTPSRRYAVEHGMRFAGGSKVISQVVSAKQLFTDGNSLHEWGYDPT